MQSTKLEITPHSYEEGDVQSLECMGPDGRRVSTGIVRHGKPHSFPTSEQETITVNIGSARINGKVCHPISVVVIPAGEVCTIEALGAAAYYTCAYGQLPATEPEELWGQLTAAKGHLVRLSLKDGRVRYGYITMVIDSRPALGELRGDRCVTVNDTPLIGGSDSCLDKIAQVLILE